MALGEFQSATLARNDHSAANVRRFASRATFSQSPYRSSGRCFRCGRTATVARRARTSSRKRLLLGFCSGLVPLGSPQNPAGTSRRALLPRRAVRVAFRTLTNHRPSLMLLRVDCKALWRCGLYAAEALTSGSRLQDATSSEVIQHPRWVMGMFDGRGL
jgi:hypothetical protein